MIGLINDRERVFQMIVKSNYIIVAGQWEDLGAGVFITYTSSEMKSQSFDENVMISPIVVTLVDVERNIWDIENKTKLFSSKFGRVKKLAK